ncbi:MAG: hypothetical protein AAGJ54_03630 [Planctomycetota bacterium]
MTTPTNTGTPPVKETTVGRLRAAIWENTTREGRVIHSVRIERLFKRDEQSKWESTGSFGKADMLALGKLGMDAYDLIAELEAKLSGGER